jgi:thioredoxin-like negative regulator of GroEL
MRRLFVSCALALTLAVSGTPGVAGENAPKVFGEGSWQDLTGAHKGQPLIVHFWSVACAPCLAELPEWGKFLAGNPGVPLVLVNWESRPQPVDRIRATLAKAGLASAEQWALADNFEQKIRFAIDRDWMGELPRTQPIAQDGSVTTFSGAMDFSKLTAWLDEAKSH